MSDVIMDIDANRIEAAAKAQIKNLEKLDKAREEKAAKAHEKALKRQEIMQKREEAHEARLEKIRAEQRNVTFQREHPLQAAFNHAFRGDNLQATVGGKLAPGGNTALGTGVLGGLPQLMALAGPLVAADKALSVFTAGMSRASDALMRLAQQSTLVATSRNASAAQGAAQAAKMIGPMKQIAMLRGMGISESAIDQAGTTGTLSALSEYAMNYQNQTGIAPTGMNVPSVHELSGMGITGSPMTLAGLWKYRSTPSTQRMVRSMGEDVGNIMQAQNADEVAAYNRYKGASGRTAAQIALGAADWNALTDQEKAIRIANEKAAKQSTYDAVMSKEGISGKAWAAGLAVSHALDLFGVVPSVQELDRQEAINAVSGIGNMLRAPTPVRPVVNSRAEGM